MTQPLRFDGKVVLITGAGQGLGRSHALLFGARGAKVVVNDLGGGHTGGGKSSAAADAVVAEIKASGGEAVANYDSVEDGAKIVQTALDTFGRIDVVVNNAGILRDSSFQKMTDQDWDLIYKVHVLGAYKVTKAAWDRMRDQGYGRIVFTSSAAGIYGNFGQANYALAKLGLVGFASTLALEGRKKNVHVNTIAPIAGSRMTETVLPKELLAALSPEYVSPLVAYLCHEETKETGGLFEVGGGFIGKLRWERTVGKTFKIGRALTPETIATAFPAIVDFSRTTHPTDVTGSMQPILGNIQGGPSKGGNEFIDVDAALGFEFPEMRSEYTERDLTLYALGVGAGHDPLDSNDLRYVYELHGDGFQALPTFAVTPALNAVMTMAKDGGQAPGMNYGFDRILHGEQYTEVKRPLPTHAKLRHKAKITDIFDKGKSALVVTEVVSYDDATGEELIRNQITTFVRGAGGWGGDRGPSAELNVPPDRAPDATIAEKTSEGQALLYRLTGDWNPLHADPAFAQAFGFPKPILHGLCTFGYVGRHVIKAFAHDDPRLFKSIKVRFAESVFPGETIKTEMWRESATKIVVRATIVERNKVCISHAAVELFTEIPVAKAKPAAASLASAPSPIDDPNAPASSGEVFLAIRDYVAQSPELASKVANVFLFKLSNPDSAWTVNLRDGTGSVASGAVGKADCTLELSNADFLDMTGGKADAQKLYFAGKLKISGNVMASQKLEFLKKLDPERAKAVIAKARSAGAVATGRVVVQAGAPAPTDETSSADVFAAIADHLARNPALASKVANVFLFKLTNPDSAWTVNLKDGNGAVAPGVAGKADCTLELTDADFLAMTSGKADAQKLYFGGKMKISGNVMASQKLEFLKKIDPEHAKAAVAKARAEGTQGAAVGGPSTTPSFSAHATNVFAALGKRLASNAGLASEVGSKVRFKVKHPDAVYLLDGANIDARDGDAPTTVTIADEDLVAWARGDASAQTLYQQGKLRVDGDVQAVRRLTFIAGVLA